MNRSEFGDITMLKVNDLRCIDVFEAELGKEGKLIPIVGPNGAGKSTIIDAISILFEGGQLPDDLIRHGKKEAFIEAMSNRGVIVRKRIRTTSAGKQVTDLVLSKDNQPIASPQKALKELFGGLMSPNTIANAKGSELYNLLVKTAGIDLDKHDNLIADSKRTISELNGEKKALGLKDNPGELPDNLKDLPPFDNERYVELQKIVAAYETQDNDYKTLEERITKGTEIIRRLEEQLSTAKAQLKSLEGEIAHMDEVRAGSNYKEQVEEYRDLSESLAFQNELTVFNDYNEWFKKIQNVDERINKKKRDLSSLESNRTESICNAKLEVPGLSLDETGSVLFNGNRWENTCFSDRMKAAAILTMKGLDPEQLNLMYMEHGESLSKAKRLEIAEACKSNGVHLLMEVFVEEPADSDSDGIILNPVAAEPVIPAEKEEAPAEVKPSPAPFGKPIPKEILNKGTKSNPFDSVDTDIFGGNDDGLDF